MTDACVGAKQSTLRNLPIVPIVNQAVSANLTSINSVRLVGQAQCFYKTDYQSENLTKLLVPVYCLLIVVLLDSQIGEIANLSSKNTAPARPI